MTAHSQGSARTLIGKIKAAEKVGEIAFCDVYITGHVHLPHHHVKPVFVIDEESLTVKEKYCHFITCGSFLDYWDSYAEKDVLPPLPKGVPLIKFLGVKHEVKVVL